MDPRLQELLMRYPTAENMDTSLPGPEFAQRGNVRNLLDMLMSGGGFKGPEPIQDPIALGLSADRMAQPENSEKLLDMMKLLGDMQTARAPQVASAVPPEDPSLKNEPPMDIIRKALKLEEPDFVQYR